MKTNIMLQAKYVQDEITALHLAHPEIAEDQVLLADMVEGETSAFEFLSMIVHKIDETAILELGAALYIEELVEELRKRRARFQRRDEALRKLIMRVMHTAELRKAELPERTLSIRAGQQKVLIINEAEIPGEFMRIKKEPDRPAIKASLVAGVPIPGCVLSNGEPSLAILVK